MTIFERESLKKDFEYKPLMAIMKKKEETERSIRMLEIELSHLSRKNRKFKSMRDITIPMEPLIFIMKDIAVRNAFTADIDCLYKKYKLIADGLYSKAVYKDAYFLNCGSCQTDSQIRKIYSLILMTPFIESDNYESNEDVTKKMKEIIRKCTNPNLLKTINSKKNIKLKNEPISTNKTYSKFIAWGYFEFWFRDSDRAADYSEDYEMWYVESYDYYQSFVLNNHKLDKFGDKELSNGSKMYHERIVDEKFSCFSDILNSENGIDSVDAMFTILMGEGLVAEDLFQNMLITKSDLYGTANQMFTYEIDIDLEELSEEARKAIPQFIKEDSKKEHLTEDLRQEYFLRLGLKLLARKYNESKKVYESLAFTESSKNDKQYIQQISQMSNELERQRKENERLKLIIEEKNKEKKSENKKNKNIELEREVIKVEKENEKLLNEIRDLNSQLSFMKEIDKLEEISEVEVEEIANKKYLIDENTTFIVEGGSTNFVKKMKNYIISNDQGHLLKSNILFTDNPAVDPAIIASKDRAVILTNAVNHSIFYKTKSILGSKNLIFAKQGPIENIIKKMGEELI